MRNADYDVALREFEAAVQLDPDEPRLRSRLANLYVRARRPVARVRAGPRRGRGSPDDVQARLLLAGTLAVLGREDEAAQQYGEIIELDPGTPEAYLFLAALSSKSGNDAAATATLERLVESNPNSVMGYYYLGRVHAAAAASMRPSRTSSRRSSATRARPCAHRSRAGRRDAAAPRARRRAVPQGAHGRPPRTSWRATAWARCWSSDSTRRSRSSASSSRSTPTRPRRASRSA